MTKEQAIKKIKELIKNFESNLSFYKINNEYNETEVRRDFIDPFFSALGWDINNEQGFTESYREVKHEAKQKVKEGKIERSKFPDYGFRIKGKTVFYVEAKQPFVSIKDDIEPAYQLRRYGRSANLSISILTDFEEFSIYDCSKKPNSKDRASVSRLKYITYKNYIAEFDFLWDTFSKENVYNGSLDKYVKANINKKGTDRVDTEFLQTLDDWRTYLATSICLNNKQLDEDEINFAVQQTIDRLIFMRIAEDRNVEQYGQIKKCIEKGNYYQNLFEIFKKADEKYNSGLFDFKKDRISKNLQIENKIIKNIVTELYFPDCPYEFSVLPVEIFGSAYEQFLGKIIRITPAHHAVIEEKPEVRKAGGVYYTPQYIVEYIVRNTIGKLIKDKTPKEISKIKIVDPACGSGSFLIGAYQYLLDWHKDHYSNKGKPSTGKKESNLTPEGNLTTAEKKRILLNNIFGVDIDVNAVEVTKLSLLLKCMEGETDASINQQLKIWDDRVLPTLENNIKNGNSLIDTDFYSNEMDFGYDKKINPFNWEKSFSEVFKTGGFDVVIGNPPYVTIGGKEDTSFFKQEVEYLLTRYVSNQYKPNLYAFFYEKGLSLLKEEGVISFIVPRTFIDNIYYKALREYFVMNSKIISLLKLNYEVFDEATTGGTSICIFQKANPKNSKVQTFDINNEDEFALANSILIKQKEILISEYKSFSFSNPETQKIVSKISKSNPKLEFYCSVNNGVNTGNAANFLLSEKSLNNNYRKILEGKDINRFRTKWKGLWIHYDPSLKSRIKLKDLQTKQNKIDFALRDVRIFDSEKIIIRQTGDRIIANLDSDKFITRHSTHLILNDFHPIDLKFLLGLLNSKLMDFYYNALIPEKGKAFAEVKAINVKQLPIKNIDKKNKIEVAQQNEIIKLVEQLFKLNEEKLEAKLQTKIFQLESKIDYCEDRINEIVYNLYCLTKDEIEIISKK